MAIYIYSIFYEGPDLFIRGKVRNLLWQCFEEISTRDLINFELDNSHVLILLDLRLSFYEGTF